MPIPVKNNNPIFFVDVVMPVKNPVLPKPTCTVEMPIKSSFIFATYNDELLDKVVVPIPVDETTIGLPLLTS